MNPRLLIVLIALFLTACATRSVKDDAPASDLDALVANVAKTTRPTLLPNGRDYCAELAASEDDQDECMGDLEDALYNANQKAARTRMTVERFVAREHLRRNPCSWWERLFRRDRCEP